MKLSEKLKISPQLSDFLGMETGLKLALQPPRDNCSDFDRANKKFQIPFDRYLISLACYYSDEWTLAASHARNCISECDEYLFGSWRSEFTISKKNIDAKWWKQHLDWIIIFEASLLWGGVLGEWEFLKKLGTFPEPDSHIDSNYGTQGRDLYVAFGAFLRDAPRVEMETSLERASAGSKKFYKLLASVIRACLDRNAVALQKTLTEFLKYYRQNEFPKEQVTKKITSEGTFFVHWAKKEGIAITVSEEFIDHIVQLK